MVASLVIVAREVLEASLLLGIIFAYLGRTQNQRHFRTVWLGVAMAVAASVLLAVAVIGLMGQLSGVLEEGFEGFTMLLAGVVLTYVILWMKAHLHSQGKELHGQLQTALDKSSVAALASLAFLLVFREGAESVLYLAAIFAREPGTGIFVGAGLGFGGAVVVGYAIYRGSRVLDLAAFFRVTTIILIVFAAGMVGQATLALQAAGLFPGTITLWDTSGFLPDASVGGVILRSLVGYSSTPSLLQAIFYVSYLALVLSLYRDTAARPQSDIPDVPFAPIGSSYSHLLYRLIRRPGLTTVLAALMAIFLIGLLVVAILGLHFGPFDNRGPLAWGPFTGPENENNLFNFAMWIIWLPLLSVGTVLFGRLWCGNLCPLRLATDAARGLADWLQGGSSPVAAYARVGWLLPTTFILVTFFVKLWPVQSVALYGAIFFLIIFGVAVMVGLLFRRGTWCRFLCPVGAWLARITRLAPLGLRPQPAACAACPDKPCLKGTERAGPCPVYLNPSKLETNRDCLKCWSCVVNCPEEKASLRLGWRAPGAELLRPSSPYFWESLYVASLMGMYLAVGHRSLALAELPFPALFFGAVALLTLGYLALCWVVARLSGMGLKQAISTLGYIFLPLEFATAVIAFGDDALEFFNIVTPAASLLLGLGFVWSVVLGVSILRHQAPSPRRALAAAAPVAVALVALLFVWLGWYATGVVIDLT